MIYCIYLSKDMVGIGLGPLHYNDLLLLVCGWYDPYNDLKYGRHFYTGDDFRKII